MKRLVMVLVAILLPASAFSFGWVNISNAYIEQLDMDSYRLRLEVDYGESFARPYADGPSLYGFSLDAMPGAYNPTLNATVGVNDPGNWLSDDVRDPLVGAFGYDFDAASIGEGPFTLNYTALLSWTIHGYDLAGNQVLYDELESHSGSLDVYVVPEPATFLLTGLGLMAVGAIRRFR
jgi:hypothetical protein